MHFWEWLFQAGHVQQSLAAAELWAELSPELLPCLGNSKGKKTSRFIDFLGCTAKEKWELAAVLFPASISQSKPPSFLFHCSELKPWAVFFIFSFLQTHHQPFIPRLVPAAATLVLLMPFAVLIFLTWDGSWKVPSCEISECWKIMVNPSY